MKLYSYLFLLLGSFCIFGQTAKINVSKLDSVKIEADNFIGFDGFGNCIFIKNNTLFKKNEFSINEYQNIALGRISKVDIVNPLKTVVFYQDFNTAILLDSQYNETQKIDFSKINTPDQKTPTITAVGMSGQNKLWCFDSNNNQIGLYDLVTSQYKNISTSLSDGFDFYTSDFNYFNWIDLKNQWYSCNIYGKIKKNGYVEVTSNLQLLERNMVLFSKDNKLFLRDRNIDKLYEIEIVEKSFEKFYYKEQILSIFTDQGLTNYKITIP